jgi:hypothetical protein
MTPTIPDLYTRWKAGGVTKAQLAAEVGVSYGALAGKFWRYEQHTSERALPAAFPTFYKRMPDPWRFEWDDFMTFADVQLPHVAETWLDRACLIGERYLTYPRRLIIAGDLVNLDAFGQYDPQMDNLPTLGDELKSAVAFFSQVLHTFQEVYWFFGNHERRGTKATKGTLAPLTVAQLVLGQATALDRVQVSPLGYCYVTSGGREWIIAHGKNYSVQQLNVAEWLSWKYKRNVVSFHEHHLATGFDRYKQFQLINGGGLFQADQLGYAVTDASKSANMMNGFVLFRRGVPHLFGPDGFTDWRLWIEDKPLEKRGGAARKIQQVAAGIAKE